jgi:alpha-1,2-mannosyltransferase
MRPQAAALRAGLALNVALAIALLVAWAQQARQGAFWQADFTAFYTGWSMVRDGQGARLYDLELQREYQHRLIPERARQGGVLPFNHPPHAVLPFSVFALLPWPTAFYAWTALQGVLLVLFLHVLIRLAGAEGASEGETRAQLVAAVLGFPGLFVMFQMGQVALLVSFMLVGFALALLDGGRPAAMATFLVLGSIKPQLVLVPAVLLLAGGHFRALAYAAVFFAAYAGMAATETGLAVWEEFVRVVLRTAEQTGGLAVFPQIMFNVKGLLFGLLGPDHSGLVNRLSLAALVIVLIATFLIWRRAERDDPPRRRLRLALCLQLGLLANPHLNPADTIAYAVPAALALAGLSPGGLRRAVVVGLIACPLVMAVDLYGWPGPDGGARPFFVAMLLLAGAMIAGLLAPPRPVWAIPSYI